MDNERDDGSGVGMDMDMVKWKLLDAVPPHHPTPHRPRGLFFVSAGMVLRSGRIVDCPLMLGLRGRNERNNRMYAPTSHLSFSVVFFLFYFDFFFFFLFFHRLLLYRSLHLAIYMKGGGRRGE